VPLLASTALQLEPVSPELVLVDPALAERERARLEENARRAAAFDVEPLRRAVERELESYEEPEVAVPREIRTLVRRTLVPAALSCSLFANGVLAALLVVHPGEREYAAAAPRAQLSVTSAASSAAAAVTSTVRHAAAGSVASARSARKAPVTPLPEKAVVEQKLVSLILRAPAKKLPRRFLDPETGLVRNNVRVVCRPAVRRSYRCLVQLPGDSAVSGLLVRYRRGNHGKELFRWYGYKRSAGQVALVQKS
jgi:hypothetical protein